ncbi:protein SODIUM POTASSIUM ROOT DEFECTIVE 3-like isoform X1 [Camellia sinensis]|uniref:protein SODIUM POTASSIUM ROOT DEFECTIVE 3-like isoform X1 n=1 Tax=Camellia sinensis TaxID=4442 RepID=UPI001035F62F|nr:protein SODIUM POTASSIUM ROOT DEFECTIVE 3-like isoform X1 [Camellia sinensis]
MKGIDIFCASQSSTAIRLTMDEASSSSSPPIHLGGGRAIDRHNPIIRDAKRIGKALPLPPCTSQPPPIAPIPYNHLHRKGRKSSSSKSDDQTTKKSSSKSTGKKSFASDVKRKSGGDLMSPVGSSRYLLAGGGDKSNLTEMVSDFDPVLTLVPVDSINNSQALKTEDSSASNSKPPSSSSPSSRSPHQQVVVLRVSLHCKGCEGKVRKHISRMQGVTSFNIDFAAKKVTVVGDVTPLGVLASISKVKNAQLLTPAAATNAMPSSVPPAAASNSNTTYYSSEVSRKAKELLVVNENYRKARV